MIFRRKQSAPRVVVAGPAAKDETVARLTAKADLILEQLEAVVKQMSTMLKESVHD